MGLRFTAIVPYPLRDLLVEIQRHFVLFAGMFGKGLRLHLESHAENLELFFDFCARRKDDKYAVESRSDSLYSSRITTRSSTYA